MSEHTPLPVAGYTPQSQVKIDAVNQNKELEEHLLRRLDDLAIAGNADMRWAAIARSHFEQGFMALNRAIFQPQRIKLDGGA